MIILKDLESLNYMDERDDVELFVPCSALLFQQTHSEPTANILKVRRGKGKGN